jgi:hypothetical protein
MAAYIHDLDLKELTALNEREFFYNDEPISAHAVNSIIDNRLRTCEIWDPNRGVHVGVSNRLINEVRGAMARKWPRLSDKNRNGSDNFPGDADRRLAQRVAAFADNQLCLDADAWTPSATLWDAWIAFDPCRAVRSKFDVL